MIVTDHQLVEFSLNTRGGFVIETDQFAVWTTIGGQYRYTFKESIIPSASFDSLLECWQAAIKDIPHA